MTRTAPMRDLTKAVTANRLADGVVVYLARNGSWTESLAAAALATAEPEATELLNKGNAATGTVIGPYLIDVSRPDAQPLRLRERIRHGGPTIAFGETRPTAES